MNTTANRRGLGIRLDAPTHLEAVQIRQTDVQHDYTPSHHAHVFAATLEHRF